MSNSFYNHGSYPTPNAPGSSAAMRAELDALAAGFDKLPTLSGNANKVVVVNSGGTALTSTTSLSGLTLNSTSIGLTTPAAGSFTNLTASGTASLGSSVTIGGGAINATPIGGTTPAAGAFTTLSASSGLTGNVTGNLTGSVTGNVTASSGTSTFNNVTVNGTLNMDSATVSTITGLQNPTANDEAANKGYVDTQDALKLSLSGGTMSGAIAMGSNKITGLGAPTASGDATTKTYVDTQDALKLSLSGGTMSGAIAMGSNKITGLGTPTDGGDATTKTYVDGILGSATSAAASALAAANSASDASGFATAAQGHASDAQGFANDAAASYDSFDDRYLGSKNADPTLDNDGNALITGALYWNSVSNIMKVWTGSAWAATYLPAAGYLQLAGGTMTGDITFSGTQTFPGTLTSGDIGTTVQAYDADLTAWAGKTAPTGDAVGTTDTQTLTNKTISAGSNTLSGIAASSFVLSNASGNIDGSAAQKVIPSGVVVGTTDTQTLTNKTIEAGTFTNGYTEETVSANTSTAYTINLADGSVQILTLTGNCTYTFPTATAGKSFLLVQKQDATGSRTVTWPAAVKWPASTAPTLTSTASKADVFAFTADGTNWFGRVIGQNYL